MGSRADRKLNPAAVKAANAAVGNRKLHPTDPADAADRKKWMEAYKAAGGGVQDTASGNPPAVEVCEPCAKPKIVIQYLDCPVRPNTTSNPRAPVKAKYFIRSLDPVTGELDGFFDKEGTTDADGKCEVPDAPDVQFTYWFEDDQPEYQCVIKPQPTAEAVDRDRTQAEIETVLKELTRPPVREGGSPPEPTAEQKAMAAANDADGGGVGDWLIGFIQGDFNKQQTAGQAILNGVLGLVPFVDQGLDIRDLIAGIYHLIEYYCDSDANQKDKKKYPDVLTFSQEQCLWLNLVIIAVGCIPVLGSAVKGVLKGILNFLKDNIADLGKALGNQKVIQAAWSQLVKILNHFGYGHGRFLEKIFDEIRAKLDDVKGAINGGVAKFHEWVAKIKKSIQSGVLAWWLNAAEATALNKRLDDWIVVIEKRLSAKQVSDMTDESLKKLEDLLNQIVPGKHKSKYRGTSTTNPPITKESALPDPILDGEVRRLAGRILSRAEFDAKYGSKFADKEFADAAWKVYRQASDSSAEIVIGRLPDTKAAGELGMTYLNIKPWNNQINDAFIQGGIDAKKPFYLGSNPSPENLINPPGSPFPNTVFHREMEQLKAAGYTQVGDYMLPP